MGCQSSVVLENNLTFSICTHDADTGALTDASAAPAYRVYEDETATAILTGTMAKLDDANTLGFYTELIACTAANGFEAGKSYTVYIEATVDGITGGISYAFTVETGVANAVWDEPRSGHTVAGTFGEVEDSADVAAALLDHSLTGHDGADTVGAALTDAATGGVDAIMAEPVDGAYTFKEVVQVVAAAVAGKPDGVGTNTITFRDLSDTKDVITAVVDTVGNVETLTLNP